MLPKEDCGSSSKNTRRTKIMPIAFVFRNIWVIIWGMHKASKAKDEEKNNYKFNGYNCNIEPRRLANTKIKFSFFC
jgi:hypothetical protein